MASLNELKGREKTAENIIKLNEESPLYDDKYHQEILIAASHLRYIFPEAVYETQYSSGNTLWSLMVQTSGGNIFRRSFLVKREGDKIYIT